MAAGAERVAVMVDLFVRQRVDKHGQESDGTTLGYLYGKVSHDKIQIIGCAACRDLKESPNNEQPGIPNWKTECEELSSIMPTGMHICGIYYSSLKPFPLEANILHRIFEGVTEEVTVESRLVVWHLSSDKSESSTCIVYNKDKKFASPGELHFDHIASASVEDRTTFRIQSSVAVCVEHRNGDDLRRIMLKIERICKELSSTSSVFHLEAYNLLLSNNKDLDHNGMMSENCTTLSSHLATAVPSSGKGKGRQKDSKNITRDLKTKDVVDVQILCKLSKNSTEEPTEVIVPVLHYEKAVKKHVNFSLPIDAIIDVQSSTLLKELPSLFIQAVCCQLKKMATFVQQKYSEVGSVCIPKSYHFRLPGFCHLVTVIYQNTSSDHEQDVNEEELKIQRLELHKRLLLPTDKPLMRTVNSYSFDGEAKQDIYLTNPHTGISISGATGGTIVTVEGRYSYHHYMQDNFSDDGWGCAYRSLQTLCSWFRHQGYTRRAVPSHREIQQALVDIGDKPKDLVDSKQWIGSFEVSLCLEHLLAVTSKILYVNSGAELGNKGRELMQHFRSQGTPVMIGGGVLAHTILGVDYNNQTGDIRFLILDPHYTGGEDIKFILDKGWCGWKGPNFWNQQAHYNLCMPQRPSVI